VNVGINKLVTVSGLQLIGQNAANYALHTTISGNVGGSRPRR
jgi:hypothetical protein